MSARTHDTSVIFGRALRKVTLSGVLGLAFSLASSGTAAAHIWYVAAGGSGDGSSIAAPLGRIQQGVQLAQPGDTVLVAPGTYSEMISTVRSGLDGAPITIKASGARGSAIVSRAGQVLQASHAWVVVEGLVFDGQYAPSDAVKLNSGATRFILRNSEVRRTSRDCIDMVAPSGVLIERTVINRCLWWDGTARRDAHGIVAGAVRGLTIRDVEIHTFSGDAIQLDPGRALPGWDDVLVENTTLWLAPLPAREAGFAAGVVPGENGIDTKTHPNAPRASMVVRNTTARGFRNGLISNMAAFNIKENVEVTLDGVTVTTSEAAFRLRGPGSNGGAWVRIRNGVVQDVTTGIRYEDDIELVEASHMTFGLRVGRVLQAASSGWAGIEVRNSIVVGASLPMEAPASGRNQALASSVFVDAAAGNYRLVGGASPVDAGQVVDGVAFDREGKARVQGTAPDLGAYERASTSAPASADAPVLSGAPAGTDPTNSARLSWSDLSGETAYEIERSADGVTFARVTTLAADKTLWFDGRLQSGRTYWFRMRAMTGSTPGRYSNSVAVKLAAETAVPSAPTGLALALSSSSPTSTIVVRWTDTSLSEDGFEVQRSTDGVTFARASIRGVNKTSVTDDGLRSRQQYWYRVRAFNGLGAGGWTPAVSLRTQ